MNRFAAVILTAGVGAGLLSAEPVVGLGIASAGADVCANAGGPDLNANGCLPPGTLGESATILGSIAVADAADEWRQRMAGRPPCYTPHGVPYYTPGDAPCG